MKITPDNLLASLIGTDPVRFKKYMREGMNPFELNKEIWAYIKKNGLLKFKGKKVQEKVMMPSERKSNGPKGKTQKTARDAPESSSRVGRGARKIKG